MSHRIVLPENGKQEHLSTNLCMLLGKDCYLILWSSAINFLLYFLCWLNVYLSFSIHLPIILFLMNFKMSFKVGWRHAYTSPRKTSAWTPRQTSSIPFHSSIFQTVFISSGMLWVVSKIYQYSLRPHQAAEHYHLAENDVMPLPGQSQALHPEGAKTLLIFFSHHNVCFLKGHIKSHVVCTLWCKASSIQQNMLAVFLCHSMGATLHAVLWLSSIFVYCRGTPGPSPGFDSLE